MVNEILREREHQGFGERNEYGSRMGGGGIEVSKDSVFEFDQHSETHQL